MPCYKPLKAWRTQEPTVNGKKKIVFRNSGSSTLASIKLPCGQCVGCRLERSRQWAVRCLHESSLYSDNCFVTLTYDDDNLPWDHSLVKHHFQDFMKRLRKRYAPKKLRFYHSGEYGEATPDNDFIARPHYHALIFNHQFTDREIFTEREGIILCTSDTLDDIWGKGLTSVGEVTFESAAYVARYIMKKALGPRKDEYYLRCDHTTGELIQIEPEYSTMSLKPGIGADWYARHKTDCFPSDSISIRGVRQKPPRYYDTLYDMDPIGDLESIKQARKQKMRKHLKDNTPERLAVRETVKLAQTTNLYRTL